MKLSRYYWYWPPAGGPGRRLLLPAIAFAAAVLLIGGLYIVIDYRSGRQAVVDGARNEAARIAFEVDHVLAARLAVLKTIAAEPRLARGDLPGAREQFDALDASALGFDGLIFFVDRSLKMQASTTSAGVRRPDFPMDVSYRPYLHVSIDTGQPYIGPAFMGTLSPRPLLPLTVPVRNERDEIVGLVGGTLLLDPGSANLAMAPGTQPIVVDRAGQIIVHNGVAEAPEDVSSEPLLAEMRAAQAGVLVDVVGLRQAPGRLVAFAGVPAAGWTIVVSAPMSQAMAPVMLRTVTESVALVASLAVALAIGFWTALAADRSEEAKRLVLASEHSAREIAEGLLQAREREIDEISHDLRSPLTVIYGSASYLRRRSGKAEFVASSLVQDRAQEIEASARTMDGMIGELLDAARLQAGRELVLNSSRGDLVEILRDVMIEQPSTELHEIRLEATGPIEGDWDAARLRRVFSNLLSNAVKFSPHGGAVTIVASIEQTHTGPNAVIEVRDSGIGIPAADLPHVFERFTRGRNASAIAGNGLGLAGVQHLVELHEGTIRVESHEHRGSTFVVRLPMSPVPSVPPIPAGAASER